MKVWHFIIPGNEVRPGEWEAEIPDVVVGEVGTVRITICQHEGSYTGVFDRERCDICGGYRDDKGIWKKEEVI